MLIINVKEQEFYDQEQEIFLYTKPSMVRMEHSLISIALWESFWEKPYFAKSSPTKGVFGQEEERYYIKCMTIGKVEDYIPTILLQNHSVEIKDYIDKQHTATRIHRIGTSPPSRQTMTAELVYYWMIRFGIPFECQKWHFNRLLTLIDVCNVKEAATGKGSKLSSVEAANYNHQLNKARRAAV